MANQLGRGGVLDLTNTVLDNFKIIERTMNKVAKHTDRIYVSWKCLCNCGTEFIATTKEIRKGKKSCGCLRFTSRFRKYLTDDQAQLSKIKGHYQNSAKRRRIAWNISDELFFALLKGNCAYCKIEPSLVVEYLPKCTPVKVNGVDRIDNNLGYEPHNVTSCCKQCNRAKSNLPISEFLNWIKRFSNENHTR